MQRPSSSKPKHRVRFVSSPIYYPPPVYSRDFLGVHGSTSTPIVYAYPARTLADRAVSVPLPSPSAFLRCICRTNIPSARRERKILNELGARRIEILNSRSNAKSNLPDLHADHKTIGTTSSSEASAIFSFSP